MGWSLFFPCMLLAVSSLAVVIEYFQIKIPYLILLPILLNDTTGFLSVVCVIGVVATAWMYWKEKKLIVRPVIIYALDLAIINKLYSNATWSKIVHVIPKIFISIASWNWPVILVSTFCLTIMVAMVVWGKQIWRDSSGKKHSDRAAPISHSASQSQAAQNSAEGEEQKPPENKTTGEQYGSPAAAHKFTEEIPFIPQIPFAPEEQHNGPSMVHFWFCILLILPVISTIQFVFYRLLPLNLDIPDILNKSLDTLIYISTICVGLVVILTIWLGIKKLFSDKRAMHLRLPAVLAFLLELIIFILFFFRVDVVAPNFLEKFLTSVTNNTIAAMIVIPIVVFVLLDVGISLFLTAFFNGIEDDTRGWPKAASKKLDNIQQRIVMFVLNMIIGILNLFLFIPDFFNEIGDLLISRDDIFPEFEESDSNPDLTTGAQKSNNQKEQ